MIDERDLLERALRRFEPEPGLADRVYRRREQKRRNQRIGAGALAIVLAIVSFVALARAFRTADRPAAEPTPQPPGIFSEVGGWIAFGNDEGIWAVNPTPRGPAERIQLRIQLSERPGEPVAWSSDGSKLLILRPHNWGSPSFHRSLLVLNADGTETRLTSNAHWDSGSIAPDGSKVVYDTTTQSGNEEWRSGIYVVDADGGSPRLLLASGQRDYPDGTFETGLFAPTFSPDGTQIAYFEGMGDWGNILWVMNADGSGGRVVMDREFGHVDDLGWSPDGLRLAFNGTNGGIWIVGVDGTGLTKVDGLGVRWSPTNSLLAFQSGSASSAGLWSGEGIWVINADGSGLRQVAPGGRAPVWSPDGSRIAYLDEGSLYVADRDETHVRTLGTLGPNPVGPQPPVAWNPLPLSASGGKQPTATMGGRGAAPFVYAIAVLGAMGVLVIAWRARRRTAAR